MSAKAYTYIKTVETLVTGLDLDWFKSKLDRLGLVLTRRHRSDPLLCLMINALIVLMHNAITTQEIWSCFSTELSLLLWHIHLGFSTDRI